MLDAGENMHRAEDRMTIQGEYEGRLIERATLDEVRSVARDYEIMLVTILGAMLDRYESDPDYPYIDTKLSIFTGKDFPEPKDPSRDIRGKTAIYGTIQGRGLEALVGHIKWLPSCSVLSSEQKDDWIRRLTTMVDGVFHQMEKVRARNNGCLSSLMTPEGVPFTMGDDGRRRFFTLTGEHTSGVDVFYAKGMLAAAMVLGDQDKVLQAKNLMRTAAADVVSRWPSRIRDGVVENKPYGSGMITVGAFALFAELLQEEEWFEGGEEFVRYIIDSHVSLGQFEGLQLHDYVEMIGSDRRPWQDEQGRILLDPGHCLEFIGLAAKLLLLLREKSKKTSSEEALLARCIEVFPRVLFKNFHTGFNRQVGGIFKSVDLVSRSPINSDMPWWSLPETMRAAAELLLMLPSCEYEPKLLQIIADCSNAFVTNYVNRDVYLMAYQTVDASGQPADVIPLTSDLDPGYHTGLSIIDFLHCIHALVGQDE